MDKVKFAYSCNLYDGKGKVKENIYDEISIEMIQNSKKYCPVNAIK